jgi:predicted TIM-barrel fold metal-dependent hydrolase
MLGAEEELAMEYRVINSDGHTIEPPDMWQRYLPAKFKDRAPKVVKDPRGGDAWLFFEDVPPAAIGMVTSAGQRYEEMHWHGSTYKTINPGCWNGEARVKEMIFDGIDAEVLYPSQRTMYYFTGSDDLEFHRAGVDAYNDWIRNEFSAADPARLIPMYQMPNLGIETSLAELRRARKQGFRGVVLTHWPSGEPALGAQDEPFWAEAQALGMPVHIHINIGGVKRNAREAAITAARASENLGTLLGGIPFGAFPQAMSDIIHSGIFDRYPALKMVGVEVQAGWIPAVLAWWDDRYWRNRTMTGCSLKLLPSEYFHRNWLVTFIVDRYGVKNREDIGVGNMMWSTDYPHHGCDWPYSRKVIAEMFDGVPEDEKFRMICGNARDLYGLGT